MSYAGGSLLAIIAIIGFAAAVSGLIWLALNWPRDHDPMQNENGDVPNVPDWWR